ncbi:MAG: hypothetical protein RMK57_11920 [Bryobacterales bacterium]|nr:hypothetical protein [Bryobacteraceae bacterium]MDW8355227.1 hypothetical protein [Bryobacterales bacterium]
MYGTSDWKLRLAQWAAFNRWEAEQTPVERSPLEILADSSTILSWRPAEVWREDPAPENRGFQAMRAALSRIRIET